MSQAWDILIVDDEPDIHRVTELSLKRKTWKNQRFNVVSAYSRAEAEEVIRNHPRPFHVGFIDVVMESDDAGLQLCRFIRANCPRSFRIVLRTGQPGIAPEEVVLNEYDIDYYLAKADATKDRLFTVMRACLRSSADIATMIAHGEQLKSFTMALSSASPVLGLLDAMKEGLGFLEQKHRTACTFIADVKDPDRSLVSSGSQVEPSRLAEILPTLAPTASVAMSPLAGSELGLPGNSRVLPFELEGLIGGQTPVAAAGALGGLYVEFNQDQPSANEVEDFFIDAKHFINNWRVAYSALKLQDRLLRETALRLEQALEKAVMEKELELVSAVQSTMASTTPIDLGRLRLAGHYRAATRCGGDWWNYYRLADGKLLVILGDVTGHGAGAAMITATAKSAATTVISQTGGKLSLGALFEALDVAIVDAANGNFLMTCFASIYDERTRTLSYANAGHNFPYFYDGTRVTVLAGSGMPLGDVGTRSFATGKVEVVPGALVVWYTDGLVEMENAERDQLGDRWLYKKIRKLTKLEPDQIRDEIAAEAYAFAGGTPLRDDVTFIVGKVS